MMNSIEKKCFNQDDIRFFNKGGCHVFADALKSKLEEEQYTVKRVSVQKFPEPLEACHIFACAGGFVVDACGIKREDDYVAWLTAKYEFRDFNEIMVPVITMHDVSDEDLFAQHHDHICGGKVNSWGLFTGAEFIDAAKSRALSLIEHWPENIEFPSLSQAG